MSETINDIDEAKLLGYFETVKGTFVTKWVFLLHFLDDKGELIPKCFRTACIEKWKKVIPDALSFEALLNGNWEMVENYKEDIVTSSVIGAWIVFEQLIKDLTNPNYANDLADHVVNYQRNDFGLSVKEKNDLDVIYYIRNAILHYNGAYHSYHDIDKHYRNHHFQSQGHYGEKIEINGELAWYIMDDLEQYAIKAWQNYKAFHKSS